ncbi:MAG: ribonuclease P protein component [Candidatus Andersenbacteria bacterium]
MARIGRLRHKDDVLAVIRHGKKARTPYALIYIQPSKNLRMACVVGKKVSRLAVQRHRIQRQLREILREVAPSFSTPVDIVAVALPPAKTVESYTILKQAIISAVSKLQ